MSPHSWDSSTPILRAESSPVVVLEELLVDGMGQGEAGSQQPDHSDAQCSFCQRHPLLEWVQNDL